MVFSYGKFLLFLHSVQATSTIDGNAVVSLVQIHVERLDGMQPQIAKQVLTSESLEAPLIPIHTEWQLEDNLTQQNATVKLKKPLAIVSAMFGGRDIVTLTSCPRAALCVFYTDNRSIHNGKSAGWHVVHKRYHEILAEKFDWLDAPGPYSLSNVSKRNNEKVRGVLTARFYKMNAHLLPGVRDCDIILWMDAHFWNPECWTNYSWNPNLLENLRTNLKNSSIMVPWHDRRNNVSAEVEPAGLAADRNTGGHTGVQDATRALEHQMADGFADDAGLFWTEFFAYKAQDGFTRDALLKWWWEVQLYSFRDQISFPYIKSKFHLENHSDSAEELVKDIFKGGSKPPDAQSQIVLLARS